MSVRLACALRVVDVCDRQLQGAVKRHDAAVVAMLLMRLSTRDTAGRVCRSIVNLGAERSLQALDQQLDHVHRHVDVDQLLADDVVVVVDDANAVAQFSGGAHASTLLTTAVSVAAPCRRAHHTPADNTDPLSQRPINDHPVSVRPSVCLSVCHKPALHQNNCRPTDPTGFLWHTASLYCTVL